MPQAPKQDTQLLEAALIGFQHMRSQIEQKIADLKSQIGGANGRTSAGGSALSGGATRRTMSASARRRIALAQRARWAEYKAAKSAPVKAAKQRPKKRVLSAEGKARIIAATKKRWAAFHKGRQAGAAGA